MNYAVQNLREECAQLETQLHAVTKQCNNLNRQLEHAVWDEDMVVEETILFDGSLDELLELIGPLLKSRRWTVNGRHEATAFLRSLDSVFRVSHGGKLLALGTLVNAALNYLSVHNDE